MSHPHIGRSPETHSSCREAARSAGIIFNVFECQELRAPGLQPGLGHARATALPLPTLVP